jgi:hypothetical protein
MKKQKEEEVIDFTKPEKITTEQLERVQNTVNSVNRVQIEIGNIEVRKHEMLHQAATIREELAKIQDEFQKEYGTFDININDGVINHPKENGEVNS